MEAWTPDVVVLSDGFGAPSGGASSPEIWGADLTRFDSVEDAGESLERQGADLLILVRRLPVSDPAPFQKLIEATSSGESVQYLGSWCEGEERTGVPVKGFTRVFWHAWPDWWRRWLAGFRGSRSGVEPLRGATIAVAADTDSSGAIGALLSGAGACTVPLGEKLRAPPLIGKPAALVWSGSQLDGSEAERLRSWCEYARAKEAPLVALLDFPRPETVAAARAIGAAAVLGKPCGGGLLCDTVCEVIRRRRHAESPGARTSFLVSEADGPLRAAA